MEKLAIHGGEKAKTVPYGSGKRFGQEELVQLQEALEQNTLFYWTGNKVKMLTNKFAELYGAKYCVAASSGTAAIHVALGALGIGEGDEVITSPITDMGSIIGILYQKAIPVFADLDPHTYNMDAKAIEAKITEKTKAIVVVHLAGNAADMDAIMEVANRHGIKVIEDCAQSYLCYYKGRLAGTIGHIGCFSLNDFKHISAGDGGLLIMNDEETYKTAFRFADKNYNRFGGKMREIKTLAPNYRMNELTAAVALAQLEKLPMICGNRNAFGDALTEGIKDLPGIHPHKVIEGGKSSYWFYLMRLDEEVLGVDRKEYVEALLAEGVACSFGYIPEPVYDYEIFRDNPNCYPGACPVAEKVIVDSVKLPVNEFYTKQDVEEVIKGIRKVTQYFLDRKAK
ncbi:MAG: DegT/DnrJ/EryC1/StrS family aminotransferase [Ruminococcaceae bacterium]|nr:DegT/DnrJ/EryC1/StrS family aminotransferase [Oscillospiraceae bacterium]